jgi:hypothetical protein
MIGQLLFSECLFNYNQLDQQMFNDVEAATKIVLHAVGTLRILLRDLNNGREYWKLAKAIQSLRGAIQIFWKAVQELCKPIPPI